jgi:hypothetical protein
LDISGLEQGPVSGGHDSESSRSITLTKLAASYVTISFSWTLRMQSDGQWVRYKKTMVSATEQWLMCVCESRNEWPGTTSQFLGWSRQKTTCSLEPSGTSFPAETGYYRLPELMSSHARFRSAKKNSNESKNKNRKVYSHLPVCCLEMWRLKYTKL